MPATNSHHGGKGLGPFHGAEVRAALQRHHLGASNALVSAKAAFTVLIVAGGHDQGGHGIWPRRDVVFASHSAAAQAV